MGLVHKVILTSVLFTGSIATYFAYSFSENLATIDAKQEFNTASTTRINKIKEKLRDSQGVLLAFKAFFDSSDDVTEDDFANFAAVLTQGRPQLSVLAWLEQTSPNDSPRWQSEKVHYPLRYSYSYDDNTLDSFIDSEQLLSKHIPQDDTDLITMKVLALESNHRLLILSLPILAKNEPNRNLNNNYPAGYLVMAVDLSHLIIDSVKILPIEPIILSIQSDDRTLALVNPNGLSLAVDNWHENTHRHDNLKTTERIQVTDSRLTINASSNLTAFYPPNYLSTLVLVVGSLITLALTYFVHLTIRRHLRDLEVINKKTVDLDHAQTVILKQEKQLASNAEKKLRIDEIQQALVKNEFCLYYQPKVNMRTGNVFGVEALIRWLHPEKGLIPPLDFLPLLDGTDLECQIGDWVIHQALHQLAHWHEQGIQLEVSVNISSHHLQADNFFDQLNHALQQNPSVASKSLQLEILESASLGDLKTIIAIIKKCQDNLGVRIALDDFGTGYSSLTHLRNLPVDIIKIDKSFTQDMLDDPSDYAIIDGVIGLAEAFNREVVAEGVEATAHGLILLINHCEQAQGYGIARPMPADSFTDWLTHYSPNQAWLNCGQEHRTIKQSKVKSFKLIITQWKNKFITNIQSQPTEVKSWPIMDHTCCLCNDWLKRTERTSLFAPHWLIKLASAHENLHTHAQDLWQRYQQEGKAFKKGDLTELHAIFDEIMALLELESKTHQIGNKAPLPTQH